MAGKVVFEGVSFCKGADHAEAELTTADLRNGSKPQSGACTIVDRFNANWDVKSLINFDDVKKAVSSKDILAKLARVKDPNKILKLLALDQVAMLADYSELKAQSFVKGHLVAEVLGGKGDKDNLTPMSKGANALYHHNIEKYVRDVLREAAKIEANSEYRIKIRFTARCSGSMKPWWSGATDETKRMLKELPARVDAEARLLGFFHHKSPGKVLTLAQLKKASVDEARKFDRVTKKLKKLPSLNLAL